MKGLIIKDLMCLRKQMILFAFTVAGVFAISVMFVLSSRFGNIAAANQTMMVENNLSDIDIKNLSTMALILFMLLPIAAVSDVTIIFRMDGKAGFSNISSIVPIPVNKRVLARYMTVFIMFGTGIVVDVVISIVLSMLTDIIPFADFLGIIITAVSIMCINGALEIVFCFLLGYGKEDYAVIAAFAVIIVTAILANIKNIKAIMASVAAGGSSDAEYSFDNLINFIKYRYFIILAIAVIVVISSYFASVSIARRKRGIV